MKKLVIAVLLVVGVVLPNANWGSHPVHPVASNWSAKVPRIPGA
jgi:5-deoxy-D-glucuronate isomerase